MQLRHVTLAACLATAPLAGAEAAISDFDGRWRVAIAANSGKCPSSYILPLSITEGAVRYTGMFNADATGRVNNAGAVVVELSYKRDIVRATGKLGDIHGRGQWVSPTRGCAGTWTARRF